MEIEYHIPVLLNEAIEGLNIKPNGVYVDVTFGGGGHSREVLKHLGPDGRLLAFDQDEDAARNAIDDPRFLFAQHNFRYLKNFLRYYELDYVDGILADLGVSSHHFDMPERGFSFRFDAPLDMRMNQSSQLTASKVLNEYSEEDLLRILRAYGEVDRARKIASILTIARTQKPIKTTFELVELLTPAVPKLQQNKVFAQVFQALRIEVNQELVVLTDFLNDAADVLKPGGRLVVISYHSLEDRLVKNLIQKGNIEGNIEKDFYGNMSLIFNAKGKVIVPSPEELERNPRSRSSKLRIAEKC
jgi:16S rRNA (cytosine1402-N4)-methyltransferase